METSRRSQRLVQFGAFKADLQSGELWRDGQRVKLQDQPFQVMACLLERPGEVISRDELRKKLWPDGTFVDFDRGLNKAVTKLRDALGDSAETPRFIETVPQRGYRFIAPVDVQNRDASALPEVPSGRQANRRSPIPLALASGIAVVVLLVTLWMDRGVQYPFVSARVHPSIEAIAVLPLENLSGDPAQEYFADGMTDELIGELDRMGSMRVISRTSVMQFKGARQSLPDIAKQLRVDAVVEGTVLREGGKVRITAKLIRAANEAHIWSGRFERPLGEVLRLQSEVAQAIASHIVTRVRAAGQQTTVRSRSLSPQAYEAYLMGNFFLHKAAVRQSLDFFAQAIRHDSSYAPAHAGLAQAYIYIGILGLSPPADAYGRARTAAMRALQLDGALAEAHNVFAEVEKNEGNWSRAESEYKLALELNPNHLLSRVWYAEYLSRIGQHEAALEQIKLARQLDPLSTVTNVVAGMLLYRSRRYDEAIASCQKALDLVGPHPNALWWQALALQQKHEYQAAVVKLDEAATLLDIPLFRAALAHGYAVAGNRPKALAILSDLLNLSNRQYVAPKYIALIYAGLGDHDTAFSWFSKAYEEHTANMHELPLPHFDSLRGDPRYAKLLRGSRLPQAK